MRKGPTPKEIDRFRDLARSVMKHHFGTTGRLRHLSGGLTNYVFGGSADEGDFVIRISPDVNRMSFFIKEQWAVRKARSLGIPVPEILEVGLEAIGLPYMVVRSVEGESATDHPERMKVLRELGKIGSKLNSARTMGFGETFDWSENKLSRNATFDEWLQNDYQAEAKLQLLEKHGVLEPKRAKAVLKIFRSAARGNCKPVFNHSDLRLKNVMVDADGNILAVIDWEGCVSNVPEWELSLALHDLGVDEIQSFLAGYDIRPKKLEDSIPLIRAFNITNYASGIAEVATNKELLEHYRLRLNGSLDLYSI